VKFPPIHIVIEVDSEGPTMVSYAGIPHRPEGMNERQFDQLMQPILRALHLLRKDTRTEQRVGLDNIPALKLAADLLHPEAYGWAVPPEVARQARRALGQEIAS
jgi:hypothetical protein